MPARRRLYRIDRRKKPPYRMVSRPPRPKGVPVVRVVVDPGDDRDVLRSIELLADAAGGVAVVTPTPGNPGAGVLYHDILNSVGRWSHPQWLRHSDRTMWRTRDLLRHRRIGTLIVVRAHSLTPNAWLRLCYLAKKTPLRLWLVVHGGTPQPQLLATVAKSNLRQWISNPGVPPLFCLPGSDRPERHFYEHSRDTDMSSELAIL